MTDKRREDSPPREWRILLILAAIQFSHICDFVILMPLGPMLMRELAISPSEFGVLVSIYTFSAGISSFLAALLFDRFDRKRALLALYLGFLVATAACGFASSYATLLTARALAGAFGGTLNAVILAIIGDIIPLHRRGAATGTVMAAFAAASILGLPIGILAANRWGWGAPFIGLAILSIVVWIATARWLPAVRAHLSLSKSSALKRMIGVFGHRKNLEAFALVGTMMFAGFSVIPYLSPYLVRNAGLRETQLPLVYFCGGVLSLFTSRWIGKRADRHGLARVFSLVAVLSMVPIFVVTHLPEVPLVVILIVTTSFMVLVSGRMVPAMALMTTVADTGNRGSFMLVVSSVQQLSVALASYSASRVVIEREGNRIGGFSTLGWIALGSTCVAIGLANRIVRRR